MEDIREALNGLIMVGQLGFSLVVPPLVLGLAGFLLSNRFKLGKWVILLFIAIGLLTSLSTAVGYYSDYRKKAEKEQKENPRPRGFNDHL